MATRRNSPLLNPIRSAKIPLLGVCKKEPAMPSKKKQSNKRDKTSQRRKVGSDPAAAENFAEKNDFGIPSEDAAPDMTVEDRDFPGRPAGNKGTRSGASGKRTIG